MNYLPQSLINLIRAEENRLAWDIRTKRGENHLGKILMKIREGLKD